MTSLSEEWAISSSWRSSSRNSTSSSSERDRRTRWAYHPMGTRFNVSLRNRLRLSLNRRASSRRTSAEWSVCGWVGPSWRFSSSSSSSSTLSFSSASNSSCVCVDASSRDAPWRHRRCSWGRVVRWRALKETRVRTVNVRFDRDHARVMMTLSSAHDSTHYASCELVFDVYMCNQRRTHTRFQNQFGRVTGVISFQRLDTVMIYVYCT